jgi:nicotinate-nucleotide pyrophosphorylase (carboxylating)
LIKEGSKIKKGDIIIELEGDAKKILQAGRTALNFLIRLSGIATATHELLEKSKTRIAATRKTYFQYSDKRAVMLGGGYTHRLGLFDEYLIKKEHISIVQKELNCSREKAIEECLKRVKEHNRSRKLVEIEVGSYEEALAAAKFKPDIIMLDGIDIPEMKRIIDGLKNSGIFLEASGGVRPENIENFKEVDVDIISSGYITHSCKALDMSLEIVE